MGQLEILRRRLFRLVRANRAVLGDKSPTLPDQLVRQQPVSNLFAPIQNCANFLFVPIFVHLLRLENVG